MSSKLGLLFLCLLTMVGVAPSVFCAEAAPAKGSPSISQLETFAGTSVVNPADVDAHLAQAQKQLDAGQPVAARAILNRVMQQKMTAQQETKFAALKEKVDAAVAAQKAKLAAAGPTPGGSIQEQARRVMEQARQKAAIQKQADEAKAAQLVSEGSYLLYNEGKAKQAYDLAKQAVELNPSNKQAQDLLTAAGVRLNKPEAKYRLQGTLAGNLAQLRLQSAWQTFNNSLSKARQLYAAGKYEQALSELRNAEFYVNLLAASQDVSTQRSEVENLKSQVEGDYAQSERQAATQRTSAAASEAAAFHGQMQEQSSKRNARMVDSVLQMIDDKQFDEAKRVIDNLEVANSADPLVPYLRKQLSDASYYDTVNKQNAARARGDQTFKTWANDEELIPEHVFNYPDKTFWKKVAEKRKTVEYPSQKIAEEASPADQAVQVQLQQAVPMQFDQTSLQEAADFLRQVTKLNIVVLPSATQQNPSPITLQLTNTPLSDGLDQICAMTNTTWRLQNGIIKIGSPQDPTIAAYETRVYDVRDLLYSTMDFSTGIGNGNGGGYGNGGGGGGGIGGLGSSGLGVGSSSNVNRNGGGLNGSFPAQEAQFGGSNSGGSSGGYSNSGNGSNNNNNSPLNYDMYSRATNLVMLIKQSCGVNPETWLNPYGVDVYYVSGSNSGNGSSGGFGNTSGGGGGGFGGGGFGGAGRTGAVPGAAGAAGGFGFPGAAGFGAAGATGAAGTTAATLPQGRAFPSPVDFGYIIIYQTPAVHKCIEKLLHDMRQNQKIQVHVDVRFLSVTSNFLREVGFQWNDFTLDANAFNGPFNTLSGFTATGNSIGIGGFVVPNLSSVVFVPDPANPGTGTFQGVPKGYNPFGVTFTNSIPSVSVDSGTGEITYDQNFTQGNPVVGTGIPFFPEGANTGLNLNVGYGSDTFNLTGLFRLANSRDELRSVSAPQITLANGQQGFLSVSTGSSYVSGYNVSNNTLTPNVSTVADVIELSVRPVVSADRRYVFMELYPVIQTTDLSERANFTTFTGQPGGGGTTGGGAAGVAVTNFITLPKVTQQTFGTTVGVPDRGVVIVGGLSKVERDQHEAGVPILDKIPILKRLFSAEGRKLDRDALFIMAKPQIQILDELEHRMD